MIKRANLKKKKGFSLIELIIVLAVMAIIALIAIPNFSAVRESSKIKADKQSGEAISRSVETLLADGSIQLTAAGVTAGKGYIVIDMSDAGTADFTNTDVTLSAVEKGSSSVFATDTAVKDNIVALLKNSTKPQEDTKIAYVVKIEVSGSGINTVYKVTSTTQANTTVPTT